MRLEEGSEVADACFVPKAQKTPKILLISKRGYGKRTLTEEFRLQKRGGSGILGFNITTKSGSIVGACPFTEQDDVSLFQKLAKRLASTPAPFPLQRRTTAGSRAIKLSEGDSIAFLCDPKSGNN